MGAAGQAYSRLTLPQFPNDLHENPARHTVGRSGMKGDHQVLLGDPFLRPNTVWRSRIGRLLWNSVYALLFQTSPRPFHRWRAFLLRLFGAKIGANCHIYPHARIWAPWHLVCEDVVAVADGAEIYNAATVTLKSHAILSQHAYLCGATHDCDDPAFPMICGPIMIGRYAWIAARAAVQPGVTVGDGAVLGLGAIATRDLEPWSVYAGAPARLIRMRRQPQ
jgi:putative colanic acid biosynthesis acetyltransferase WcaF